MADVDNDERFFAIAAAKVRHSQPLDHFGRNEHGYDLGGADGQGSDEELSKPIEEADFGDGAPGRAIVADTLRVWAAGWQRWDISTAATVFHLAPELVWQVQPIGFLGKTPQEAGDFANAVQLLSTQRVFNAMDDAQGQAPADSSSNLDEYLAAFRHPTVAEIAALLNVAESDVAKAVEDHPWMFLGEERDGSPEIEQEGE